jgi:hypothetical protein
MALSRVSEIVGFYGPDSVLLIGGDLFRQGSDLEVNARRFRRAVEDRSHARTDPRISAHTAHLLREAPGT